MFSSKSKVDLRPKSQILAETAGNALSVFHSTINKLKEVISNANQSIADNQKQIDALEDENQKLNKVAEENTNMVTKLAELFSPHE